MRKSYWQDWVVMGAFGVVCLLLLTVGCTQPPPPVAPKLMIFVAEWCVLCPTAEQIERLEQDHPDVSIYVFDVDQSPDLKEQFHVKSVPRFFLCDAVSCRTTTSFRELQGWLDEL